MKKMIMKIAKGTLQLKTSCLPNPLPCTNNVSLGLDPDSIFFWWYTSLTYPAAINHWMYYGINGDQSGPSLFGMKSLVMPMTTGPMHENAYSYASPLF